MTYVAPDPCATVRVTILNVLCSMRCDASLYVYIGARWMTCVSETARFVCFPRFTCDFLHEYCVCAFVLGICSIEARDLVLMFVSVTRHVCATCQRRVDRRCCRLCFAFMVFCFALGFRNRVWSWASIEPFCRGAGSGHRVRCRRRGAYS